MPPSMMRNHFQNTPEALLERNDSKNPATTCRGITSSGRPCRRALAASITTATARRASTAGGVVALVEEDGRVTDAQFYCWQHKDQAAQAATIAAGDGDKSGRSVANKRTEILELKNRSSIETFVQRLGLQTTPHVEGQDQSRRKKSRHRPSQQTERADFPGGDNIPHQSRVQQQPPRVRPEKKTGSWKSLCCMLNSEDDEYIEIVRHRKRVEHGKPQMSAPLPGRIGTSMPATLPYRHSQPSIFPPSGRASFSPPPSTDPSKSETKKLLALIPPHTPPQIASSLLTELTKPPNPNDEDGYIYVFWLTPSSNAVPSESTTRSLLSPERSRPRHGRRISDVMTEYSYSHDDEHQASADHRKTILLKIGRANNVTRRMNEWQRQCGYELNLIRWYPYVSTSTTPSPLASPAKPPADEPMYPDLSKYKPQNQNEQVRKVPCVKRVERLVHLELANTQIKRECTSCGREHREWFEIAASEKGVREIDGLVRRWVEWSERENGRMSL